ncbi:putative DSBA family oxidoreductase [Aspergillus undulatus]|uniref:putative DSBA family oxidoreductase n=1 Tax=Aspergillus undulatus TaxID=1810928 RepID=UPI003CCD2012
MGGKKIECYIDVVSPYSFYAFDYLQINRAALKTQNVEFEFIPVFLGGINVGSGNKPPWELPAKAAYSKFDTKRAQRYFGHDFGVPDFFPILSLLPQRALTYIKHHYPKQQFEAAFHSSFKTMWNSHLDISKPHNLIVALENSTVFNKSQITEILAGAAKPEIKKELTDTTAYAVKDLGAFGCPWFWVHDGKGNAEPFFGSDRFHYMWAYLGLEFEDLKLKDGGKSSGGRGGGKL